MSHFGHYVSWDVALFICSAFVIIVSGASGGHRLPKL